MGVLCCFCLFLCFGGSFPGLLPKLTYFVNIIPIQIARCTFFQEVRGLGGGGGGGHLTWQDRHGMILKVTLTNWSAWAYDLMAHYR